MSFAAKKSELFLSMAMLARRLSVLTRFTRKSIHVHGTSWISRRSVLQVNGGGSIRIGRHCDIHPYAMLMTYGGDIHIGDYCSVNPFTLIYGCGGAEIGNGVRIAAHAVIIPESHIPGSDALPLYRSGTTRRGICIEDNVWIGAGVKILDGVTIGRNSVVGAGAVVNRSLPPGAVAVGVPARIVRMSESARVDD